MPSSGSLTRRELYRITRLATGDKARAADARSRRALAERRAGRTPEV
jgi:hypothetical protein